MSKQKDTLKLALLATLLAGSVAALFYGLQHAPQRERAIDCTMADVHPDYSKQVREQCRVIRAGRLL